MYEIHANGAWSREWRVVGFSGVNKRNEEIATRAPESPEG